ESRSNGCKRKAAEIRGLSLFPAGSPGYFDDVREIGSSALSGISHPSRRAVSRFSVPSRFKVPFWTSNRLYESGIDSKIFRSPIGRKSTFSVIGFGFLMADLSA